MGFRSSYHHPYQLSHDLILGKPLGVELESVEEIKT